MTVHIIAHIFPRAGKEKRAVELIKEMSEFVRQNEPDTLKYQLCSETDKKTGKVELLMLETYTDMKAVKTHGGSKEFQAFGKQMQEEDIQEQPMRLQFIKEEAGFDRSKL